MCNTYNLDSFKKFRLLSQEAQHVIGGNDDNKMKFRPSLTDKTVKLGFGTADSQAIIKTDIQTYTNGIAASTGAGVQKGGWTITTDPLMGAPNVSVRYQPKCKIL